VSSPKKTLTYYKQAIDAYSFQYSNNINFINKIGIWGDRVLAGLKALGAGVKAFLRSEGSFGIVCRVPLSMLSVHYLQVSSR